RGGETVSTQALFASVSAILIFGQVDTNGSFHFGTANAPTASEIAGAQAGLSPLAAAGARVFGRGGGDHDGLFPMGNSNRPPVWGDRGRKSRAFDPRRCGRGPRGP